MLISNARQQVVRVAASLAVSTTLLLGAGCGTDRGGADDAARLPDETYRRVLSQGVDPGLVYTIELPGFELAEQSAGVVGDSDYAAVHLPVDPPLTTEVYLEVRSGPYATARCERDLLRGATGGSPVAVDSCEPDDEGWYRTGGDWHEYVVRRAGHHLVLGAPTAAVDRETLTETALEARRHDQTATVPASPSSPPTRGDLPTSGDGAPIDPHQGSPAGG
ncbi:hypothetical protein [Nocardioides sp. SYSU DS0651]|uniref:hypothetical protein n=1 Tax=Nocardioides sp. SYSU DS0651 TaxID=3415955 RepID=UPI003F4B86E8